MQVAILAVILVPLQIKTIIFERFPFSGVYHDESASEMV